MSSVAVAKPGWYPDTSGRFRFRYHDGVRWTEHVVDDRGQRGTDPVGAGPPTAAVAAAAVAAPTTGWRAELPLAVSALGGLLVLLSAFTLAFLGERGSGASLHQIGQIDRSLTGWPLGGYAELGRFATLPLAGFAGAVSTHWVGHEPRLMRIASAVAGAFGAWHLVAMFVTGELDTSPAFGALVGVAGYVGLVAGPCLRLRTAG